MPKAVTGFKCPRCQGICHTRTSRPVSNETVVRYYVCRKAGCEFVFKTFHVFTRFLCRPAPPDTAPEQEAATVASGTPHRVTGCYSSPFRN